MRRMRNRGLNMSRGFELEGPEIHSEESPLDRAVERIAVV
jgi:hypothetical protein